MKKTLFCLMLGAFAQSNISVANDDISNSRSIDSGTEQQRAEADEFVEVGGEVQLTDFAPSPHFVRLKVKPVAQWQAEREAQGASVTNEQRSAYIRQLDTQLHSLMAAIKARGLETNGVARVSDVGFSVFATDDQVEQLLSLAGIQLIMPKQEFTAQRRYSTNWIGAERAHTELGYTGKGQTIAIIDSGIDYLHADFGGSGLVSDFLANDPSIVEAGSFPTAVVIGGYDLAGRDYNAASSDHAIPQPDPDPLDDDDHGTHVAGIAAGRGIGPEQASGIAPGASLYALNVFGAGGSTALTAEAIEKAVDPNGDGDPSDAVDVINMSLGSPFGSPEDSSSVSAQNAVAAGLVVVASAGNGGNGTPYVSGSPAAAEGVIAVASSIPGGQEAFFLRFRSATGESLDLFAAYAALSPALSGRVAAQLERSQPYDACSPPVNAFAGNIAVITQARCLYSQQITNVQRAGASAAIVISNTDGRASVMGGTPVALPAAMISQAEGARLLEILANSAVIAEFAADNVRPDPSDDDTIAISSSRGPGPTGLFKPDVTAPGVNIESARAGSGDGILTSSGTSMAAPQVAGMAALLREKFPALDPRAIKAIIQNSARPARLLDGEGSPPLSLQGTGVVDIVSALSAEAYAAPGGLGFGVLKPEYNAAKTLMLSVTNFSDHDQHYDVHVQENSGAGTSGARVDVASRIYVSAGQTQKVPVTLRVQAENVVRTDSFHEFDGWIVLTNADSDMRVGFTSVLAPASKIQLSERDSSLALHNVAYGDASVFTFTLAADNGPNRFGFRSYSTRSVVFAVNVGTEWTTFSQRMLRMDIDVDEDGVTDYIARVGDLARLEQPRRVRPGTILSVLDNVRTGQRFLRYLAQVDQNSSSLRFLLDAYGSLGFLSDDDSTFNYRLRLTDFEKRETRELARGRIDLSQQATFKPSRFTVPAQGNRLLSIDGPETAMLLIPSEREAEKRAVIIKH